MNSSNMDIPGNMNGQSTAPAEDACPDLSIVIPAYNEIKRLPTTLEVVLEYLKGQACSWEVIVSDDGSIDGTPAMIRERFPQCRLILSDKNQGKGAAVRRGMIAACGRMRLFSDADLSTPIDELTGMIKGMSQGGYDIVIASRAMPESRLVIHQPWWREWSGRMFNRMVQVLAGLPFVDTQCGFKLFSARAADLLFGLQQSNGWAFDVELLMLAGVHNMKVLEHPVRWINDEASKVNLLHDAPRMFKDVLRFRWMLFNGKLGNSLNEPASPSSESR